MKFQDDISNMNTCIHTDKPKPVCPHFFKVGGIKTKALISFAVTAKQICVFVFAYAKSLFSHDSAQFKIILQKKR